MSDNPQDKPKIIVDEDWKSQVQAEKEQLERQRRGKPADDSPEPAAPESAAPEPAAPESSSAGGETSARGRQQSPQLPPASFPILIQSLATQTLVALGQLPGSEGKAIEPQPELARHFIDTLAVLEEKTQGNLTTDEAAMLENVQHELRMLFISVGRGPGK